MAEKELSLFNTNEGLNGIVNVKTNNVINLNANATNIPVETPVLSVTELSMGLKRVVETQFRRVKVRGEVSGYKKHTSGHMYFALKDNDSVIDAVCWRGTYLQAQLTEGAEVIATGRLTTYPGRSKYQIVVEGAEIAGEGALLKILMERKDRLQKEGLFDRKKPLPPFPGTIGVVTSATGAVIQDILHRLNDRYPCHVLVWPVAVQGVGAAEQISTAINGFNNLETPPDLIIVARGGGSLEDLWCFNEEIVVRAAANSKVPLISAVGHETDVTLVDWAADLRAPTPTAAAELATPVLSQLRQAISLYDQRLYNLIQNKLSKESIQLQGVARALPSPQQMLDQVMLRLDDWGDRLYNAYNVMLRVKNQRLLMTKDRLRAPTSVIEKYKDHLETAYVKMCVESKRYFQGAEEKLAQQVCALENSSYNSILKRGFSLVTSKDGQVINSASKFKEVGCGTINFADGKVGVVKNSNNKI